MEEYYINLSENNKADKKFNNLSVFNIGEGDVEKFSILNDVYQLWVLPSKSIQLIYKQSVRDHYKVRSLY